MRQNLVKIIINLNNWECVDLILGVYVKVKGVRDQRCSILVSNYVSCMDSLAATHKLGSISVSIKVLFELNYNKILINLI